MPSLELCHRLPHKVRVSWEFSLDLARTHVTPQHMQIAAGESKRAIALVLIK